LTRLPSVPRATCPRTAAGITQRTCHSDVRSPDRTTHQTCPPTAPGTTHRTCHSDVQSPDNSPNVSGDWREQPHEPSPVIPVPVSGLTGTRFPAVSGTRFPPLTGTRFPTGTRYPLPTDTRYPLPTDTRYPLPTAHRFPPLTGSHRSPVPTAHRFPPLTGSHRFSPVCLRSRPHPLSPARTTRQTSRRTAAKNARCSLCAWVATYRINSPFDR
jgi:hypothetical protein